MKEYWIKFFATHLKYQTNSCRETANIVLKGTHDAHNCSHCPIYNKCPEIPHILDADYKLNAMKQLLMAESPEKVVEYLL